MTHVSAIQFELRTPWPLCSHHLNFCEQSLLISSFVYLLSSTQVINFFSILFFLLFELEIPHISGETICRTNQLLSVDIVTKQFLVWISIVWQWNYFQIDFVLNFVLNLDRNLDRNVFFEKFKLLTHNVNYLHLKANRLELYTGVFLILQFWRDFI